MKIGLASGLSLRALSYVSNTSLLSFLPLITYATGNRSYRSMITLRYSFLPVSGTLNSVTSVAHFSLGFVALNSLFSLFPLLSPVWTTGISSSFTDNRMNSKLLHDSVNPVLAVAGVIEMVDPACHPPISQDMSKPLVILLYQFCQFCVFGFLLWNCPVQPFIVSSV